MTVDDARKPQQARRIARACRNGGALFIVSDSAGLAPAANADGLRIGRENGAPAAIGTALGAELVLGESCYDQFERALARRAADYVAFGSVFVSSVKRGAVRAPLGLFAQAREAGLHAVAIGGIDAGNAFEVVEAGAAAVAVITAVFGEVGGVRRADATSIEANARRMVESGVAR